VIIPVARDDVLLIRGPCAPASVHEIIRIAQRMQREYVTGVIPSVSRSMHSNQL
jgi:hypothetical protein